MCLHGFSLLITSCCRQGIDHPEAIAVKRKFSLSNSKYPLLVHCWYSSSPRVQLPVPSTCRPHCRSLLLAQLQLQLLWNPSKPTTPWLLFSPNPCRLSSSHDALPCLASASMWHLLLLLWLLVLLPRRRSSPSSVTVLHPNPDPRTTSKIQRSPSLARVRMTLLLKKVQSAVSHTRLLNRSQVLRTTNHGVSVAITSTLTLAP